MMYSSLMVARTIELALSIPKGLQIYPHFHIVNV
jgi:hypothetical protein